MNEYQQFQAEDFMQEPSFRDWVAGQSPQVSAFWEGWLRVHPEKTEVVLQAREALLALWDGFDELPESERTDRVARIRQAQVMRAQEHPPVRTMGWGWWAMAASIFLALGLGWLIYTRQLTTEAQKPTRLSYRQAIEQITDAKPTELMNTGTQLRRVSLPDGSVITLSPKTKISYPPDLGQTNQRTVYLSGEAFFEISRNPTKPFFVYANGVVTKVLGTSFRIRAYETSPQVLVQVRTGRVSVYGPKQIKTDETPFANLENGVVLTPNQQVILAKDEMLVKSVVPQPALLHPEKVDVGTVYTDTPVSQIFKRLEESYGIEILYDETTFRECLLTARLYDESLMDQVKLICKSIGATYTVMDARIIISGEGCR